MSIADRNRLAARVLADYTPYDYPTVFAGDMNAVAGVGTDAQVDMEAAAASATLTALDRVQTSLDRAATDASNLAASVILPVALDRVVGERANDTSLWSMVRSTPIWGFGPTGLLEQTAIDTVSWEFNPVSRAPFGISFAGARTNLTLYSEQFDDAYWTKTNATITANAAVAPSGATTAGQVNLTTTSGEFARSLSGLTIGVVYCCSVFLKAGTETAVRLRMQTTSVNVDCNLSTGAVTSGGSSSFGSMNVGNGWWRIWGVFTAAATSETFTIRGNGVTTGNFFAWGTSFEVGVCLGPYIPTTTATVSRAQGTVSIPVRDLGSKYNYRQGVLILDWNSQSGPFTSAADTDFFGIVSLGDLGANDVMGLVINAAHTAALFRRTVGGVVQSSATLTITPPAAGETVKFAMAWDIDAGFMQVAARGAAGTKLTGHTLIPAITHLMPGRFSTTRPLFGRINKIEFLPAALFDSSLAAKT